MSVRRIQLKDITAAASGKTAIIKCPIGPCYRGIFLEMGNTAAGDAHGPAASALANEIRVVLGSTPQRRCTAAQLDVINTAMGAAYASDAYDGTGNGLGLRHLPIFFYEPWRERISNSSVDLNALSWTTNWLGANDVFQVEIDLAAITPALSAYAIVDDTTSNGPRGIVKWYPKDYGTTAATLSIASLFQGIKAGDLVSQISLFDTSDAKTVTLAQLDINGKRRWDLSANEQLTLLKKRNMNPAAGAYHIVFDHDDALNDLEPTAGVTDSLLQLTLSAASNGTMRAISQRLGMPDAS
ncbi:MAG: major capsid protein P2 [Limisphaerales bacterium]